MHNLSISGTFLSDIRELILQKKSNIASDILNGNLPKSFFLIRYPYQWTWRNIVYFHYEINKIAYVSKMVNYKTMFSRIFKNLKCRNGIVALLNWRAINILVYFWQTSLQIITRNISRIHKVVCKNIMKYTKFKFNCITSLLNDTYARSKIQLLFNILEYAYIRFS